MIQINRLSVRRNEKALLEDISFRVKPAQVLGIYGPNGSGKSTLLKTISSRPEGYEVTGDVIFNGVAWEALKSVEDRVKKILYVGSDFRAPFDLAVNDLLELSALVGNQQLWPTLSREDREKVARVVQSFGIQDWLDRVFRTLSDGEKQWVMFARACIQGAGAVAFDESFSKLDLDRLMVAARLIREYAKQGLSIIVCSHDLNFLSEISDEILLLKQGRLLKFGGIEEVFSAEVFAGVYPDLKLSFFQSKTSGRPKIIY